MTARTESGNVRMSAREVWTLTVVCSAVAMVIAAAAALNSALPAMALETGATQSQLTWIVDSYTLTLAALLLPAGALGDRFGRRGVLLAGLAIVAVASAGPVWLDSPTWLIAFRAVGGIGAALVMPATLSLLTATFPPEHRARGVAIWSGVAASGGIAGLLVSGLLLEHWSWQSIFVGFTGVAVALFAVSWTIAPSREQSPPRFDLPGAALAIVAVGLFVLGMLEGPIRGWTDPLPMTALVVGVLCAAVFTVVELRRAEPLLDVRLFGNREFGAGAASITLQFLASFALFYLIVQYMQLVLGYSPLQSGLALAPMIVPTMLLSAAIPWLLPRVGLRWLSVAGLVFAGLGMFVFARVDADSGYGATVLALLIYSVGVGLCTAPATHAIVDNTPDDKQGVASAVNDTTREIGAAVGIALAGSLLAATYSRGIEPAVQAVPEPAKEPVGSSLAAALQVAKMAGPQGDQLAAFARLVFMDGMSDAARALGAILLMAAVVVGVCAPGRRRTDDAIPDDSSDLVSLTDRD
ncbi:MFS transporter [Rhodococcus sp. NPDC127528]|uniref:MFS transporter n=1 Tax=unclassified Rhodococcus (in: high G+C Gram-positive bacteria) TaxID=192944 RepID=UPI00363D79A9